MKKKRPYERYDWAQILPADDARAASTGADHPFADSEVRSTLRSVYRYRERWRALGHKPEWIARQSWLGRKGGVRSGESRRAPGRERDLRIVVMREHGLSQREVAAVEGVSRRTVRTARDRLARGVGHEANTDRDLSRGLLF